MPIANAINSLLDRTKPTHLTTFTVKVDGNKLPVEYGIIQIDIENAINSIPTAYIMLEDGDVATQNFDISSASELVPGNEIEILSGYSSDEDSLFKGIIVKQRVRVSRSGNSFLQIECKDPLFRLTLNRKSRYFKDVSDNDIFDEIVGEYEGVSANFGLAGGLLGSRFDEIVQYQISDWDFLIMRAEKSGKYCVADDGELSVSGLPTISLPVFSLKYGVDIIDVDLEMDACTQFEGSEISSWDDSRQEIINGESDNINTPQIGNIDGKKLAEVGKTNSILQHTGNLTQDEMDAWAEGQMLKSRMSKIKGTVKFQGSHLAAPGKLVDIGGLGDRFNGTAFVSGVQHNLGRGDWVSTIQIGFSPEWHYQKYDAYQYPTSGFTAPVNGLQIGIVTQLENDPDGKDRIKVRLPIVDEGDEGTWARLASFDAGNERGFVARPELDDEVVVGFLNDDPNQAIILGSLYSSANPAPIAAQDDNFEKGWTTKSGIKILINDDAKTLEITTPNENKILLTDEDGAMIFSDENGNTITLNSDGITLESGADIILKATGDIKAEGTNIEYAANAQFKAEGSSGLEVSSSGQTVVKGSIVNIN